MHDFTPFSALLGGSIIGLSASLLLLTHGKVAGISGLYAGALGWARSDRAMLGAVTFGVGWGLGGFCPGPGLVRARADSPVAIAFIVAMTVGMLVEGALGARATQPGHRSI